MISKCTVHLQSISTYEVTRLQVSNQWERIVFWFQGSPYNTLRLSHPTWMLLPLILLTSPIHYNLNKAPQHHLSYKLISTLGSPLKSQDNSSQTSCESINFPRRAARQFHSSPCCPPSHTDGAAAHPWPYHR